MNDIDWSKAPEGATHYMTEYNEFSEVWIKDITNNSYKFIRVDGKGGSEWEYTDPITRNELKGLIERPKTKSTYTQAMADNGELPSVGMECEFFKSEYINYLYFVEDWITGDRLSVFGNVTGPNGVDTAIVYNQRTMLTSQLILKSIRPIDTRTESEKAEGDMVEQLINEGIISYDNIMLKILIAKIKANKIHGVTWSGKS